MSDPNYRTYLSSAAWKREGVRGKTKMTTMVSPEGASARDGSDTGDEIAPLFLLIRLSGGLGRHERINRPTSVLLMLE